MVTIGSIELKTGVPGDLDRRLIESTGRSAAQTRAVLAGQCSAQELAAALAPLLAKPVHRVTLARMIASAGVESVRTQLAALYRPAQTKGRTSGKARN